MSDIDIKKIIIRSLTIAGAISGLYFIYSYFRKGSKTQNPEDLNVVPQNTATDILDMKDKAKKPLNLSSKNSEIIGEKEETREKSDNNSLIEINFFSEIFKRAINHTFEQMFFNFEVIRDDFNDKGEYIGPVPYLARFNIEDYKNEILIKIANDNYHLVNNSVNPESYNKSLQYYLSNNK